MRLLYLSHGAEESGGYRHEKQLAQGISSAIGAELQEIRYRRHFRGFWEWLLLAFYAWRDAGKADTVISVARLAWPVWWRLRWRKGARFVLVLHNYDKTDGKPRLYYWILSAFLRKVSLRNPKRVLLVVDGGIWQDFFMQRFGLETGHYPNLFPDEPYKRIRDEAVKDAKLIHLGQWSAKADLPAYRLLIDALEPLGFRCYFSSPVRVEAHGFPLRYFETQQAYLESMAAARATVILNRVAEGWSRVAHESVLCGTVLIGKPLGGFAQLLELSGGIPVADAGEAARLLAAGNLPEQADPQRLQAFSLQEEQVYLQPILEWLQ